MNLDDMLNDAMNGNHDEELINDESVDTDIGEELADVEEPMAKQSTEESDNSLAVPSMTEYVAPAPTVQQADSTLEDASDKVKLYANLASEKQSNVEPRLLDYGNPCIKAWIDRMEPIGEGKGSWNVGMDTKKWGFVPLRWHEAQKTYVPKIRGWTKEQKPWWYVEKEDSIAVLPNEQFIVLDADTPLQTNILLNIVKAKGLKCKMMLTKHGGHFYFKAPKGVAGTKDWSVRAKKAVVINLPDVDFRGLGAATVTFRKNGTDYQWVYGVEYKEEELDELPYYLHPMRHFTEAKALKYQFLGLHDGDLRNDKLFRYFASLASTGYSYVECVEIIGIINDFVLSEPKSSQELAAICREDKYNDCVSLTNGEKFYDDNGTFRHDWFGEYMISHEHVIALEQRGQLAIYRNGYYPVAENNVYVHTAMRALLPKITTARIKEVEMYIWETLIGREEVKETKEDGYWVNLNNGRFNMKTGEFTEHTADAHDFKRIPITYDPNAQSAIIDGMLETITCNDPNMITLLDEMVGYCFVRNCDYDMLFILTNEHGNNGKSTFLEGVMNLLGKDNVCSITLQAYNEKFVNIRLYKALANIFNDLPLSAIKESGMIKMATAGEPITVQEKGCPAFKMSSYATPIFGCNGIPEIYDHSGGMDRRLCLIPFDADFSSANPARDPEFGKKLCTEEAKSAWFNRAVRGYQKLVADGEFIKVERCERLKRMYRAEGNEVVNWFIDKNITASVLVSTPIADLYTNSYVQYVTQEAGLKTPRSKCKFGKEVRRLIKLPEGSKRLYVDGVKKSFFIVEEDKLALAQIDQRIKDVTSA